jgi:hypothetical protein
VLPLLLLLSVPYALLWGPRVAAAQMALSLAVALVTVEWLFLGFAKVPFTCTYLPGKANLRATWPKYAAVFLVYCGLLPRLARLLLPSPVAFVSSMGLLLAAWCCLVWLRRRQAAAAGLVFDDAADPHVIVLGLSWRPPAGRPDLGTPPAL